MASEADYVFIPESPVNDGWEDQLCNKLKQVTWFRYNDKHVRQPLPKNCRTIISSVMMPILELSLINFCDQREHKSKDEPDSLLWVQD